MVVLQRKHVYIAFHISIFVLTCTAPFISFDVELAPSSSHSWPHRRVMFFGSLIKQTYYYNNLNSTSNFAVSFCINGLIQKSWVNPLSSVIVKINETTTSTTSFMAEYYNTLSKYKIVYSTKISYEFSNAGVSLILATYVHVKKLEMFEILLTSYITRIIYRLRFFLFLIRFVLILITLAFSFPVLIFTFV